MPSPTNKKYKITIVKGNVVRIPVENEKNAFKTNDKFKSEIHTLSSIKRNYEDEQEMARETLNEAIFWITFAIGLILFWSAFNSVYRNIMLAKINHKLTDINNKHGVRRRRSTQTTKSFKLA